MLSSSAISCYTHVYPPPSWLFSDAGCHACVVPHRAQQNGEVIIILPASQSVLVVQHVQTVIHFLSLENLFHSVIVNFLLLNISR